MNINARKSFIKSELEKLRVQGVPAGGRLRVEDKIESFFDPGTFVETLEFVSDDGVAAEGVVTGYGAVNGRLVFCCMQDHARDGGAVSPAGAAKIADTYAMAEKNGAPVVTVYDCDGAKLAGGVNALAVFGKLVKTAAQAKGIVPQLAVVTGVCSGGMAVVAETADIILLGGKNAALSLSPASVLEYENTGDEDPLNNTRRNLACASFPTEEEAFAKAREILDHLPSNHAQGEIGVETADPPERDTSAIENLILSGGYDGRDLIRAIADDARFCELYHSIGKELRVGFSSVNGFACGVVASSPAHGTKITSDGAYKAAQFITLCNRFSVPVLTFCDCDGYSAADETDSPALASDVAALASAYAEAHIPLVTVIVGKLTGSAFSFLGSKALGADLVFALPTAVISPLPVASAVEFMLNEQLAEGVSKESLMEKWEVEDASPVAAAKAGLVDYICEASELRARIAAAFNMLDMKASF